MPPYCDNDDHSGGGDNDDNGGGGGGGDDGCGGCGVGGVLVRMLMMDGDDDMYLVDNEQKRWFQLTKVRKIGMGKDDDFQQPR